MEREILLALINFSFGIMNLIPDNKFNYWASGFSFGVGTFMLAFGLLAVR